MDLTTEIEAIKITANYKAALYKLKKKLKWKSVGPLFRFALKKPLPGQLGGDRRKERLGEGLVKLFRGLFFTVFKLTDQITWANFPQRFTEDGFRQITHADLHRIAKTSDAELRSYLAALEKCGIIKRRHTKEVVQSESGRDTWTTDLFIQLNIPRLFQLMEEMQQSKQPKQVKKRQRNADPLASFWLDAEPHEAGTVVNRFNGVLLQHLSNWEFCLDDLIRSLKSDSTTTTDKRKLRIAPGTKRFFEYLVKKTFALDQIGRWVKHPERFDQRGFRHISTAEMASSNCTTREVRDARDALTQAGILEESHHVAGGRRTKRPWIRINFLELKRRLLELPGRKFQIAKHTVAWVFDGNDGEGNGGKSYNFSPAILADVNTQYFLEYAIHFCTYSDTVPFSVRTCTDLGGRINGWAYGASAFPFAIPEPEPTQTSNTGEKLPHIFQQFSRAIDEAKKTNQQWAKQFADYDTSSIVCPAACYFNHNAMGYRPLVIAEDVAIAAALLCIALPEEQMVTASILKKLSGLMRKKVMTLNDVALFVQGLESNPEAPRSFEYIAQAWPKIVASLRPDPSADPVCAKAYLEWSREIATWFRSEMSWPNGPPNGDDAAPLFKAIRAHRPSLSVDEVSKLESDLRTYLHTYPEVYVGLNEELDWKQYLTVSPQEHSQLKRYFLQRSEKGLRIVLAHTQTSHGSQALSTASTDFTQPKPNSVKTGFGPFDRLTGGLQRGKLYLIGGYTGTGKTMLSLQLAAGLCSNGCTVLFAASEESPVALFFRVAANCRNIRYDEILDDPQKSGTGSGPDYLSRFGFQKWDALPNDTPLSQRFLAFNGALPDVIVVDGLAEARIRTKNPDLHRASHEDLAARLAEFARTSHRIVIATAQLGSTAPDQYTLTRSMISEAPGMADFAHVTIGISALRRPDGFYPWSHAQFLQVIGNSGGPGTKVTVYREPIHQRFAENEPNQ